MAGITIRNFANSTVVQYIEGPIAIITRNMDYFTKSCLHSFSITSLIKIVITFSTGPSTESMLRFVPATIDAHPVNINFKNNSD